MVALRKKVYLGRLTKKLTRSAMDRRANLSDLCKGRIDEVEDPKSTAFLFRIVGTFVAKPIAGLQHCDALSEVPEFDRAEPDLIQFGVLGAIGVSAMSFSKEDCGEYLHSCSLRWSHNFGSLRFLSW
jgi:hypothetical protein